MAAKKSTTKKVEVEAKDTKTEKKPAAPKVEIIRGRMPLPIVHMIKFGTEGETDGAVAAKFRTTNGKVSDVRKNRNFGYIHEDYKPSQEMLDKAAVYAEKLEDSSVLKAVKKITVADEKQQVAFDEARKASRPGRKKKEETPENPEKVEEPSDDELAGLTE